PGAARMVADLGGGTLDDTGTLGLANAEVEDGTIRIENGATLMLASTATANGFDHLTIDAAAAPSPVVIDLGGTTVDVAGTLHLRNVVLQNGTLDVENGASIDLDATSGLNNILQQQAVSGVTDLGGQTLDVTSALVLRNETLKNGTVKIENGALVS